MDPRITAVIMLAVFAIAVAAWQIYRGIRDKIMG